MQIHHQDHTLESSGLGQTAEFGMKNSPAAFQLLSSGLYTNKIRAVLREIGCNGVDAHALNGQQATPIDVKLPNRLDNQFYIRDYGPGLSHDQVMRLYTTYFDSTKQASDDFIGGFGVGSKSPFAYTDSFSVTSRQNGIERVYAAFVNDEGMPTIATMTEEVATTEPDGLMIGFSVRPEDFETFITEASEVYSSFKVMPRILGVILKLHEHAAKPIVDGVGALPFDESMYTRKGNVQLNMGGVRYPLTGFSDKIRAAGSSMTPEATWLYQQHVEVDVPIGAVSVAASREALQYDKKTIARIPSVLHDAAVRCLATLKTALDAVDTNKTPFQRAFELKDNVPSKGHLDWNRLPLAAMEKLFPNPDDALACQMALRGKYTVQMDKYPLLHIWRMQGNLYEKLHELKVKGFALDTYDSRKKIVTSLRRVWNSAVASERALDAVLSFSTRSLAIPKNAGPLNEHEEANLDLSLEVTMQVLESDTPISLDSLLQNYQAQPDADYYARSSKKYIVCPVAKFGKDGKPQALSDQDMKDFQAQKEAFYKQYGIVPETLAPLPVVSPPAKVKALPALWTVPLNVQDFLSLKKTLRGIPSSGVGEAHTSGSGLAVAYVLYDRKASQQGMERMHSTDLVKQANQYGEYLKYSTLLKEHNIPTDVHLLDKKDLPAFKTLYPHAVAFPQCLENLRQDPVFMAQVHNWSLNRPQLIQIDNSAERWVDIASKMPDLAPDSLLAQLVEQWNKNSSSGNNLYGEDRNKRAFYSLLLSTQYPETTLVNTHTDVKQLNEVYPFIVHFNYNTPTEIKTQYITEVNSKWGWKPKAVPVSMAPSAP